MAEQTVGLQRKPIVRLGRRERKILDFLGEYRNLGERLKDIIQSCEDISLSALSREERKRLEIYYLSSLNSLVRKKLVWKSKETKEEKLFRWPSENPNLRPAHYTTIRRKVTLYGLIE